MRGATRIVAAIALLALLVFPAAGALAAPTKLKKGFTVNLAAARDATVNGIVVTYGPPKSDLGEGPPGWGHYISDLAGIVNLTSPEDACLTEDGYHDFCPDGTSAGAPGAGATLRSSSTGATTASPRRTRSAASRSTAGPAEIS